MEFKLLNDFSPEAINTASALLTDDNILELSSKLEDVIDKLTIEQFLFVMGCLSKFGTHFEKNMSLIDRYLALIESDLVRLRVEQILYNSFLKEKYENEGCYSAYFKIFSKHDKYRDISINSEAVDNSIWFFCFTPTFLAHTNSMFKLLESIDNYNIKVKIASLYHNDKFQKTCNDLGAEFRCIRGNNFIEQYQSLIDQSKNALALVINGPPIHLDYVSKRSDNVVWWSHRFHPEFECVKIHLSGSSLSAVPHSLIDPSKWHLFEPPFNVKNLNALTHWETRKYNFGTFCRHELIDNKKHWSNVKNILSNCDQLRYFYAGRKEIHPKWCKEFDIDVRNVKFVGWLAEPEKSIVDMAFLLDGPILGHGLLGMEALAAGIPIINHDNTPGFYTNFLNQTHFTSKEKKFLEKMNNTIFQNLAEIHSVCNLLMDPEINYEVGNIMRKHFNKYHTGKGSFSEFCDIIQAGM